jgi:hypothetical protein
MTNAQLSVSRRFRVTDVELWAFPPLSALPVAFLPFVPWIAGALLALVLILWLVLMIAAGRRTQILLEAIDEFGARVLGVLGTAGPAPEARLARFDR